MKKEQSAIYLIEAGKPAVELRASRYEKEADFQSLLAKHPELMDGEQFDTESPRRWLLVGREVGISDEQENRWSLDHLFVDQDAIPTLVEVKRKSDTRLRREVVGQMLDYAANSGFWWTETWLSQQFAARCATQGLDPEAHLCEFLAGYRSPAGFWRDARDNLKAGRMRLVFVADQVPAELLRIVEFLNERMPETEVLALEIRYFAGAQFSTHVPRLLGRTAATETQRSTSPARRTWSRETFLQDLRSRLSGKPHAARAVEDLLDGLAREFHINWGSGKERGSFTAVDGTVSARGPLSIYSDGTLQVKTRWLNDSPSALRWQEELRMAFAQAGLPVDSPEESSLHLSIDAWVEHAAAYSNAVVGSWRKVVDSSQAHPSSAGATE